MTVDDFLRFNDENYQNPSENVEEEIFDYIENELAKSEYLSALDKDIYPEATLRLQRSTIKK